MRLQHPDVGALVLIPLNCPFHLPSKQQLSPSPGSLTLCLLLLRSSKLHISTPSIFSIVLLSLFRAGDGIQGTVHARQAGTTVPCSSPQGLLCCPHSVLPSPVGKPSETLLFLPALSSLHCFCGQHPVDLALSGQSEIPEALLSWSGLAYRRDYA